MILGAGAYDSLAQNLAVESFEPAPTDLTANTPGTMVYDQNGDLCALIKVESTQTGFNFDVGSLNVTEVVQQIAEVWVYVPFGVRKMTISHKDLGILRDYPLPCRLDKGRTYIMKLTTGNVRTIVENIPTKQFLCIQIDPAEAFLEINGKLKNVEGGVYQELLQFGEYHYRISAENYHDLEGNVTLNDPDNTYNLKLALKPAFGHVSITERSQSDIKGAAVYVDNKMVGRIPVSDLQLSSGNHTIRIMKEMYQVYNDTFTISDSEKKVLTPVLVPDFAEVTLQTSDEADIYVNGEQKGSGRWAGRLPSGSYIFETRKSGHIPFRMTYDISDKDQNKVIQVQGPTPIYGQLAISSTPPGAKITINGKDAGTTPKYITRQVIGDYVVTANLDGYETQAKSVTVSEGSEATVSFTLQTKTAPPPPPTPKPAPQRQKNYRDYFSVRDFYLDENDNTAATPATMVYDQNGIPCALIKVKPNVSGFSFDCGALGVTKLVQKTDEVWVYVPYGIRKLSVSHPRHGVIRDYYFPCSITKGRTYVLELNIPGQNNSQQSQATPAVIEKVVEEVVEEEVEEEPIPFQLVEVKPSFQGGDANQFSKWVNANLVYPAIARENGVQGRVTLQFTIASDGSVKNVRVLRGVDPSLDREAIRVVSSSPTWTPGKQRGRAVPVTYTFPVIFQFR